MAKQAENGRDHQKTQRMSSLILGVKCSHLGISGVVNRPYFVSDTIPYDGFLVTQSATLS